jgi:Tfp pilus assembly ATPase PilU
MEKSLAELFQAGLITEDDALSKANHPQELRPLIAARQEYKVR